MKLCVVGTYELFNTLFSVGGPPTAAVREKRTDEPLTYELSINEHIIPRLLNILTNLTIYLMKK
jgi:hypothetical protein